jgi:hypothetical protein
MSCGAGWCATAEPHLAAGFPAFLAHAAVGAAASAAARRSPRPGIRLGVITTHGTTAAPAVDPICVLKGLVDGFGPLTGLPP